MKYVLKNPSTNMYLTKVFEVRSGMARMQCDDINEAKVFNSYNDAIDFNFDYCNGEYEYVELKNDEL